MGFFALETYTVPVRAMERFRLRGLSLAHFGKEAQLYDEVQRNRRVWEESQGGSKPNGGIPLGDRVAWTINNFD